ncbi:MAG TPA: hypothetical protein VGK73_01050, partial [Polyangiaceae bacterium]
MWLGLALGVAGCDRPRPPEPHAEHGEHAEHAEQGEKAGHGHEARPHHAEHGELLRRVRLSDEVARAAKLALTPARREVLAETLALPGELAGDPDR